MNSFGPLLGTFVFFAVLFLIGKHLQNKEKKKRIEAKARARETSPGHQLRRGFAMYGGGQGESSALENILGGGSSERKQAYGESQRGNA
jgi:hypothetical protein